MSGAPAPLSPWKIEGDARANAKIKEGLQTLQTYVKTDLGRAAYECPMEGALAVQMFLGKVDGLARSAELSATGNRTEHPPFVQGKR